MNTLLLKEFIKLSKKQIISSIVLSCLFLSIIIIFQSYAQIAKSLIPKLQNRDENRIVYTSFSTEEIEMFYKILKNQNIKKIYSYIGSINIYNEKLGNIMLTSILPTEEISVQNGTKFNNKNNEIIIPENLYKNLTKEIINSNIVLSIEEKEITCKIIGFYSNKDSNLQNKIYISDNIIRTIQDSKNEFLIKVNEQGQIDNLINIFQNHNINATLFDNSYQTELNEYHSLLSIIKPFIFITISLFIINLFIFINDLINEKLLTIIILKLSGYTNQSIAWNVFLAVFYLTYTIFIIDNIITIILFKLVHLILKVNLTFFISYSYFISIITCILILFIALYLIHKIKNTKILNRLYTN
ncbi:MAG: hypothetical protein IJ565_06150 [Bacilli bacterium]|nr:hypothetical protein [Bacilli bacterium]